MLVALTIITPAIPGCHEDAHGKQKDSYPYPFITPGLREAKIVWIEMPCLALGIYAVAELNHQPSEYKSGVCTITPQCSSGKSSKRNWMFGAWLSPQQKCHM